MKKFIDKINVLLLTLTLPLLAGCEGDGGLSSLNSLFGGSSGGSGGESLASLGGGGGEGFVNPEPASMLLLGSGMTAMAFYRHRLNKKK